jgi:aspartyl protease family protein
MAVEVAVVGIFPSKAVLVIDGGRPRTLSVGDHFGEVRLIAIERDQVQLEISGKRARIGLGDQPVSVSGGQNASGGKQITLVADSKGHFFATGSVNGAATSFLVDTRAGIDYRATGEPAMIGTANGVVPTWRIKFSKVTVGDLTLYDVEGVVLQAPMPFALLGMSFLNRMEMRRDGATMVLRQRY